MCDHEGISRARPDLPDLRGPIGAHPRVVVVGTSCAGKTTLARRLAGALVCDHIELDALYWGTNWTVREDFLERVTERAAGERWIADGNYEVARDRLWPRATAVVWLNYSFPWVFSRALRRTFGRIFSREQIFSGNRESLRTVLFDKEGIPWWVIRTHGKRRRKFPEWFKRPEYRHLEIFELRHPRDAEAMFAGRAFA